MARKKIVAWLGVMFIFQFPATIFFLAILMFLLSRFFYIRRLLENSPSFLARVALSNK